MVGKSSKIQQNLKIALKKLSMVKTWQLILILLPLLFITATFMRFDHIKMVELKEAVVKADEGGNDAEISRTLEELKKFTRTHTVINVVERNGESYVTFGTGPLYLEKQYLRKTGEILEQAAANPPSDDNPNGNVYAAAMSVCQPQAQANGWAWNDPNYINCYMTEINKFPTSEKIEDEYVVALPDTTLYRFDFASPMWTPTLSGLFTIICLVLIVIIIIKFIIWLFIRIAILIVRITKK
ncbi:hypothetical protein IJH02_00660 [Candidatus Saccharibacteria bacterium]|nr:hypothetical protein [Candidatus Saccharibacteria bacterium]